MTVSPLSSFLTPHRIRQSGYVPILAAGMGVMFLRLLVMAKVLEIAEFAALSGALIVSGLVSTVSCFGLFMHLQRSLPVHLARRHYRSGAMQMSQTVLAALAVGGIGMGVGLAGVSIGGISSNMLLIGVIHGLSQQLFMIATTESRSNNELVRYALQHLIRSLATVFLAIPAAIVLGSAAAVLIAEAAVTYLSVLAIFVTVGRKLNCSLWPNLKLGLRSFAKVNWISMFSLLSYSIIVTISVQLDRWLSPLALSEEDFAHYSFVWIIMSAALSVQALITASVYPMIARRFALSGSQAAYRLTLVASAGMLALSLLTILPGVYAASFLVERYFPSYTAALNLVPIIALAAVFRVSDFWSTFLIVAGRERSTLIATILSLAATVFLWGLTAGAWPLVPVQIAYLAAATAAVTYVVGGVLCWRARNAATPAFQGDVRPAQPVGAS